MTTTELTLKSTQSLKLARLGNVLTEITSMLQAIKRGVSDQTAVSGQDGLIDYSWENPIRYGQAN